MSSLKPGPIVEEIETFLRKFPEPDGFACSPHPQRPDVSGDLLFRKTRFANAA
jgi:hypothetical protein